MLTLVKTGALQHLTERDTETCVIAIVRVSHLPLHNIMLTAKAEQQSSLFSLNLIQYFRIYLCNVSDTT